MDVAERIRLRKHLCADGLIRTLRACFEKISDPRKDPDIPLADALMSACAMFSLKCRSLLAFDKQRRAGNIRRLFGVGKVPCDSQMREILDPVDLEELRPAFSDIFRQVQRGGALRRFQFLGRYYLVSLDGTQYFQSEKVHCDGCLVKTSKNGTVTYCHQMVGAVIVHPDRRAVLPLCPEPIVKQDGQTKNDCERNATKRLLPKIRSDHPHLRMIVIEDGLASNAPHIRELKDHRFHYILGAKPGDHTDLFGQVDRHKGTPRATAVHRKDPKTGRLEVCWMVPDVPLNKSNPDGRVNFFDYAEIDTTCGKTVKYFSWVTDLEVTAENVWEMARGGRARWKIENETFNTLKNQDYHYEHNFGHGKQNLSVVFAYLMMLAFLVDQVQQLCCPLFAAAYKKLGCKRDLWQQLRGKFDNFVLESMRQLFEAIVYGLARTPPPIAYPSGIASLPSYDDSS